jgi:hypothetical protein
VVQPTNGKVKRDDNRRYEGLYVVQPTNNGVYVRIL